MAEAAAAAKSTIPTIILGLATVGGSTARDPVPFDTPEKVDALLDAFYKRGYRVLDTARNYPPTNPGTSEQVLGPAHRDRFVIDSKVASLQPGSHRADEIARSVDGSLAALTIPQLNVEYLHCPERTTPFEEPVAALDAQKRAGKFRKFGISNYEPHEVQQLLDIARDGGYQAPQVFQGCYNVVTRSMEAELLPLLRKHNMAYYAYSPAAGGFFSEKTKNPPAGTRYHKDHVFSTTYGAKYGKPAIEAAADKVRAAAKKHGITGHEASLRWVVHHSALSGEHGDAVILGVSSVDQLTKNLDAIEAGPLPQDVLDAANGIFFELSDEDKEGFKF